VTVALLSVAKPRRRRAPPGLRARATDQRLELVPFASYRIRPHWSFGLYGTAGLADGSPDAGVGVQVGYTP
jgi:hypothetical protein